MPTYGPLNTTVSLVLWEPLKGPTVLREGATHKAADAPWLGQYVERLKEKYFDSLGGVDFIGPSNSPFYLINAGQDLFFSARTKHNNGEEEDQEQIEGDDTEDRPQYTTPTPVSRMLPASPMEDDDESALSNISSSMFDPFSPIVSHQMNLDGPSDYTSVIQKPRHLKGWISQPIVPLASEDEISKPLLSPIPIKIQVDLSKEACMRSLANNVPSDICINIYYNGQLTSSKVIKSSTVNTWDGKLHPFSGRRVNTSLEAPFVLSPIPQADLGSSKKTLSFEERWAKINQDLLAEADEWGKQGKYATFRTPIGEYLEELSKLEVPECLTGSGRNGAHAGIIDVVIAMGRTVAIRSADILFLKKPDRKLPQASCGKGKKTFTAPKDPLKGKALNIFNTQVDGRLERGSTTSQNGSNYNNSPFRQISTSPPLHKQSKNRDSFFDTGNDVEGSTQYTMQGLSNNIHASKVVPDTLALGSQATTESNSEPPFNQPISSDICETMDFSEPSLPLTSSVINDQKHETEPSIERKERVHPNMPKKIPQKRFKGSIPVQPRPKYENIWDVEPYDIDKPVSLSTRSSFRRNPTPGPASATQAPNSTNHDTKRRISGPNFEYNQYLPAKSGREISNSRQEDPPSPSPVGRKGLIAASHLGITGSTFSNARREKPGFSIPQNKPSRSGGAPAYPSFGVDGAGDVGMARTTRSGTTFGSPDTKETLDRTTRAGTSFASPDMTVELKRKRVSSNVSSTISPNGEKPRKIPRLEFASETQHSSNKSVKKVNDSNNNKIGANGSDNGGNIFVAQEILSHSSTPSGSVLDEGGKKKRHRAIVSSREMGNLLNNGLLDSSLASFSGTKSSGPRSRLRGSVALDAQYQATAKASKLGISVIHEKPRITVFRGSKVKELLTKFQAKSPIRLDSHQTTIKYELDLPHQGPPKPHKLAGMTDVSEELTISRIPEMPLHTPSNGSISNKAENFTNTTSGLSLHPPRKPLPTKKNNTRSTSKSHNNPIPPPKSVSLRKGNGENQTSKLAETPLLPSVSLHLNIRPQSLTRAGELDATQNGSGILKFDINETPPPKPRGNRQKALKPSKPKLSLSIPIDSNPLSQPRLRSSTRTSEDIRTLTPHETNLPDIFETLVTTDQASIFATGVSQSLPNIPPAIVAKGEHMSPVMKSSIPAPDSGAPPSIPNKMKMWNPPSENLISSPKKISISTPNVKFSTPAVTTPKMRDHMLGNQTPVTKTPQHHGTRAGPSDPEWKPTELCEDSVLTYADLQNTNGWSGLEVDKRSERVYRPTRREVEGVFRATSILMGVRYVVGVRSE